MGQIKDMAVTGLAGVAGTKVMDPVLKKLYKAESEDARRQEDSVRPGPPAEVAADKVLSIIRLQKTDRRKKVLSSALHYGVAASWAPLYLLLRRKLKMDPVGAGTLSGVAMWLILDEGLSPKMGFTAPNPQYPLEAHTRGFISHLVFGWSVAALSEVGLRLAGRVRH